MKKTTIVLSMLLMMVSVSCLFFAYLWIDRSITLSYVNASVESEIRARIIITDLIENEWYGKSSNEVYQKLSEEVNKHPEKNIVLKKTGSGIDFDNFNFYFEADKLKKVE